MTIPVALHDEFALPQYAALSSIGTTALRTWPSVIHYRPISAWFQAPFTKVVNRSIMTNEKFHLRMTEDLEISESSCIMRTVIQNLCWHSRGRREVSCNSCLNFCVVRLSYSSLPLSVFQRRISSAVAFLG